jgi:hypothetical protein
MKEDLRLNQKTIENIKDTILKSSDSDKEMKELMIRILDIELKKSSDSDKMKAIRGLVTTHLKGDDTSDSN